MINLAVAVIHYHFPSADLSAPLADNALNNLECDYVWLLSVMLSCSVRGVSLEMPTGQRHTFIHIFYKSSLTKETSYTMPYVVHSLFSPEWERANYDKSQHSKLFAISAISMAVHYQ